MERTNGPEESLDEVAFTVEREVAIALDAAI
jgi:hypothetical protein